jgi:multiple antibiotic resistance protein
MHDFLLAFVSIFVAVDALGVLPIFMGLTDDLEPPVRRRIILQSLVTALAVAVGFIFLGDTIFRFMGILPQDFMVAGGVLLLVIATLDLVTDSKYSQRHVETIGAVPIGMPLIVGPATLTTCLMMVSAYGILPTVTSVVVNIGLAGLIFSAAGVITRVLGKAGSRALSKVASLILAAIAVMMVRRGLTALIVAAVEQAH